MYHVIKEAILFVKRTPVLRLLYQRQVANMKRNIRSDKPRDPTRPRAIPDVGVEDGALLRRMEQAKSAVVVFSFSLPFSPAVD